MLKLLILANCQATALGKICANITTASGEKIFDIIHFAPVFELGPEDQESLLEKLGACDVLLYQPIKGATYSYVA